VRWLRWAVATLVFAPLAAAQPLLVGLVPDVPGTNAGGDAIAVSTQASIDLAGHVLADGEGAWAFPARQLEPGEVLWVVGNATAWQEHGGPAPWIVMDPPLRLGDGGDEVFLLDPAGSPLDAVAYGTRDGSGVLPAAVPARMFVRDRAGEAWTDTDRSLDWVTPRMHRLGESALDRPTFQADAVTMYSSPDSSFQTLAGLVGSARDRLHLHVYELRSAELADLLVVAKAGKPALDLQVLVDADPVGADDRDRHATADALRRIQGVGGVAVLAGNGRYDDHHLKVLVADDAVAVQSENWVPSGVPADPSWGNRGWGAVVHDAEAADWFAHWMADDRAAWDARPFVLADFDPTFEAPARRAPRTGEYGPTVAPLRIAGPINVTPLVSPDHTEDPRTDPVAALLDGAGERIVAQHLDLASVARNSLGWSSDDPWLAALLAAPDRGVEVRVQAAAPFASTDAGNQPEIDLLLAGGAEAGVLDRPGLGTLHNKAFVVDGVVVVLGSTNGNHHSRSANREVALVIDSPEAAAWADGLFASDWDPPSAGRDWGVPGDDLHALPPAPWPTLLALLGVARFAWARR
jgi:cardiolipin synthase A/B